MTVNARIRYGLEADILTAIKRETSDAELEAIRSFGRTVLSFSNAVRNLPDEEELPRLLEGVGVTYKPDELEEGIQNWQINRSIVPTIPFEAGSVLIPALRMVEITNPQDVDRDRVSRLGDAMLELAKHKGYLNGRKVIFVDHSTNPKGVAISYYDSAVDDFFRRQGR